MSHKHRSEIPFDIPAPTFVPPETPFPETVIEKVRILLCAVLKMSVEEILTAPPPDDLADQLHSLSFEHGDNVHVVVTNANTKVCLWMVSKDGMLISKQECNFKQAKSMAVDIAVFCGVSEKDAQRRAYLSIVDI